MWRWREGAQVPLPYSDLNLLREHQEPYPKEQIFLKGLKIIAFIFIIIALARPQTVNKTTAPPKPVLDIMICLDTSLSMSALDFGQENRLDAAKKAAAQFIRKRPFDRIGLVVFGGVAIRQCPLTLDHETLIEFVEQVPMNATQTEGTAIGTAIALGATQLAESEAKSKVMILLTDGRSNTGKIDPMTAASGARDLGIKIYVIGTAVPGGGLVPVNDPLMGQRLVRMAEDLDEPTLKEIAGLTNGRYYRVTSEKRFKEIYDAIDKMETTKIKSSALIQYDDKYVPFLILALLALLLETAAQLTLWRTLP